MRDCIAQAVDKRRQGGFTLIELMVVVAIVAILALIAYPTYQDQMRKTRRSEAKIALTEIANLQEKFFSNSTPPHYASTIGGNPSADPPGGLGYSSVSQPNGYYNLTITSWGTGYLARADITGIQADDSKCARFTIDSRGVKTSTPQADCW